MVLDPSRRLTLLDLDFVYLHLLLLAEAIFTIRQDRPGLLFVQQVEGKMSRDVAKGESHHGSLF